MKHLEMIELEPYEAPALEELKLSVLRGQDAGGETNPAADPDPADDENPPDLD